MSIQSKSDVILTILSTFSFTMLGFLVTALAVIVSLSHKEHIKSFEHYGYFKVFGGAYIFTLITLLITFILSTTAVVYGGLLPILMSMVITNICQILVISIASYSLMFK